MWKQDGILVDIKYIFNGYNESDHISDLIMMK